MSFLDHWCHFPKMTSTLQLPGEPIQLSRHLLSKAKMGVGGSVCTPEQSPKAMWFLCSQYLCPDQSLGSRLGVRGDFSSWTTMV